VTQKQDSGNLLEMTSAPLQMMDNDDDDDDDDDDNNDNIMPCKTNA